MEAAAVGPLWEVIKGSFCFCCARAEYFDDLEANLNSLKNEILRLKEMKEHVETRIQHEKKPLMQQTYKVTDWLKRINRMQGDANNLTKEAVEEIKKKALRWFCPKNCCSYNRVGKRISENLKEVTELIRDGNFDVVVERKPGNLVDEMPVSETIGLESKFQELWECIEDQSVGMIGIYGMAGVGKTTLLKKMYNKISSSKDDVLIWVEISEQDPVKAVHQGIRRKFYISEELWRNNSDTDSMVIWKLLRSERFVLMLDNRGGRWDYDLLEKIGIPLDGNGNGSKIIFTTRSREVCDRLMAKSIEVECLTPETALELFQFCVGGSILNAHREISNLAKDVADACQGLQLLLTTIGRAMANKSNLRDWRRAVEKLKTQPSKFPNMEARVFSVLKVSYYTLINDTLRKCFLYFSLFSRGDNITKNELIELWMAEGFLHECNNIYDAREEGEDILTSLKLVSLLENGKWEDFVKMHDVIRAISLWIACEEGKAEDKVLVQDKALEFPKWINAERISLWSSSIESIPQIPSCHYLTTLLLRSTNLKTLPSNFFQAMPALRVLGLSDNKCLLELPAGIGNLRNLHYLNLSGTSKVLFPLEVQNLKKLQILIVDRTNLLLTIPRGVISALWSLQAFSTLDQISLLSSLQKEVEIIEELECLEHLNELSVILSYATFVHKVLDNHKLRRCIKQLQLVQQTDCVPKLSLRRIQYLEKLELLQCSSLTAVEIDEGNEQEFNISQDYVANSLLTRLEYFPNLRVVRISDCPIKNVTCLSYATNLQSLKLFGCNEMVEVISEDFGPNVFENLVDLSLRHLPKMNSIYPYALQFPSLMRLVVCGCPYLQRLPFDCNSAKNLKQIRGSRSWWGGLQWESIAIKQDLFQKFQDSTTVDELMKSYKTYNPNLKVYYTVPGPEENPHVCVVQ